MHKCLNAMEAKSLLSYLLFVILKMKKAIFDLLSKEIASGLTIDIETINFLESTMGIHDIEAIRTFFMEGSLHDSGLIDLIFYPDLDFRIKAESFIPLMGFKKNEIEISLER